MVNMGSDELIVDDGLFMDMEDKCVKFEVYINYKMLIVYFYFCFLISFINKINYIFFSI